MEEDKITIGENLKKIRKDLNLRQYQLAGDQITRNLISLIENDRTPIYYNVANIISKNINKIIHEKGMDIYIQPEDILNPDRYEARKRANVYIDKIKHHLIEKNYEFNIEELNEIETFLNKWNFIDKKVKAYELLGDIYYNAKDSNKEYYYYLKSLEVSYEYPYMKERYKIILKLVYNCIVTEKFDEAIRLCNFALSTQDDIPYKYKGIFYYNSGLAYYHKKDYSRCLDELIYAKYYINFDDYREIKRILMLEGICNSQIENYDGALRNYNKLLKIIEDFDDPEEMCLIYINIMQTYTHKECREEVEKYHVKVIDYLEIIDKDSSYLPEILFGLSEIYYFLEEYDSYEKYLNKALELSKNNEEINSFQDIFLKLMDFYIETEQIDKINLLAKNYRTQIYNIEMTKDFAIILKILYNFIEQNDNLETKNLIENLLNREV
ncbi:putative TPR repeat-containing protein [[Clostridium] ultunense Esp]|uniref:Putative TPR repeat-containing protein n=1 Tax=[Clostridium] ultunense Esp TaxID=1288971 RepID=M1Z4U2_9FIRM|nr:helix-turn-helix transcriptional regulator [Schnuerera ultunensis]CCQ92563.1 putative TPR repeat-containing protein [[Clostridium] ultunense Esp]SHD77747.1 putative TPR repeat-containing protein [[Clostridium] ultunense Esp]